MKEIKTQSFTYGSKKDSKAYAVSYELTYEKDMGYPTKINLILIHNNNKLEIAKMED
ncbi:hypothetical protein D3C80_2219280 [compost metagenome]